MTPHEKPCQSLLITISCHQGIATEEQIETILDHYHTKLAEQKMSEAEVIGERNTNRHLERYSSRYSFYYIYVTIILYVSSTKRLKK